MSQATLLSMTARGRVEEGRLAAPPTLISLGGSPPSDTSSPALVAWRLAADAGACLQTALATLAVLAAHTIIAEGRRPPPALLGLTQDITDSFPHGLAASQYGPALDRTAMTIQRRVPR